MTKAGFLIFVRNRSNFFWTLVLPIIMIVIFGAVFGKNSQTVTVGVWNRSPAAAAMAVVRALGKVSAFHLVNLSGKESLAKVKDGSVDALAELPAGFGGRGGEPVKVLYSEGNAPAATTVTEALREMDLAATLLRYHIPPAFQVEATPVTARRLTYVDFLVGGIIAMTIMQAGLFGIGIGIVQMRERGILRSLRSTPLSPVAFLGSRFIIYLVIALVQAGVILGIAMGFYGVRFVGSLPLFLGICLFGAAVFVTVGLAMAGLSRSVEAANSLSSVSNFLLMFLSGIYWRVNIMPIFFQDIANISPLTYFAQGLRDVMTLGAGLVQVAVPLAVLGAWGLVAGLVALKTYRWE